jgi:hypothetical protein
MPSFVAPRTSHVDVSDVPTALKVNWGVGLPIVEAFIDGHGPWSFVLDSGASLYAVDERVAATLNLERVDLEDVTVSTASVAAPVRQAVRIHELRVGPLVERDTGAAVFDFSQLGQVSGTHIDGCIPAKAFTNGLLTFDFVGKTVSVVAGGLPRADGKDVLDLEYGMLPSVSVEIGGESRLVDLDTGGDGGLVVPSAVASSLRFRSSPVVVGMYVAASGVVPSREGRLAETIAWGRHRIESPVVELSENDRFAAGIELLREFRVTFDFANERVRFERRDNATVRCQSVRRIGVGFDRGFGDDRTWTVGYVLDDSPAALAGIHVGDRIETVDGQPVSNLPAGAWRKLMDTAQSVRLRVLDAGGSRVVDVPVKTYVE